ncbi:hypothetical protein [Burkholderia cepacia]|uniref:hypothetical protein n=1 Tax=Burkholderia cepacia TaxID=292 RepID=UPI0015907D30|nr:hypothetical protein [Burkholderia cepacia]
MTTAPAALPPYPPSAGLRTPDGIECRFRVCPGGIAGSTSTGRPENRDDNAQRTQATPMARLGESPPRRENDDAAVLARRALHYPSGDHRRRRVHRVTIVYHRRFLIGLIAPRSSARLHAYDPLSTPRFA